MQTLATPERIVTVPTPLPAHPVAPPARSSVEFVLADGARVVARDGLPSDLAGVQELHRRCSAATRASRYHAGKPTITAAEWRYFTDATRATSVVVSPAGCPSLVVAVAHLVRTRERGQVELAVMVEDAWQGRRLGTALMEHAVHLARHQGFSTVTAVVQGTNRRARAILRRLSATVRQPFGPTVELTIALDG